MPIEWVAVSQHVYSWQPELASADGKNINCDDKNCGKCTLCRSEYFATASDYLSLLWKAPSIRATWSPSSSREKIEAAQFRIGGLRLTLGPCFASCRRYLRPLRRRCTTCTLTLTLTRTWPWTKCGYSELSMGGIRKRGNLTSRILHAVDPETCTAVVLWSIWCPGETDWEHPFQQIGLLLPRGL